MINVPIGAETIFTIGSWPVTNAMINVWIAMALLIVVGLVIRSSASEKPGRLQNAVEMIVEGLLSFFDQATGDRAKSRKFFPVAGTFFVFILLSNWMSLLPGTGSIGVWHVAEGVREFIPLLRPANSDLNLTLVMALISIIGSQLLGIVTLGFFTHANKFIAFGTIWKALKTLNPLKIMIALVEFMVGIIEVFSECAKIASLSLRLFGNIFAGEVLITVISSLIPALVPLPFMTLELIVGVVQAAVFSMLTVVYLTMATSEPHGSHDEEQHDTHTHDRHGHVPQQAKA